MTNAACNLIDKHCIPCEGNVAPLTREQFSPLLAEAAGWEVVEDTKIVKGYRFADFAAALAFVNKVGALAENEGHHPDINLHNFNTVTITLWTHAIGGLSENDFIVAAKINAL